MEQPRSLADFGDCRGTYLDDGQAVPCKNEARSLEVKPTIPSKEWLCAAGRKKGPVEMWFYWKPEAGNSVAWGLWFKVAPQADTRQEGVVSVQHAGRREQFDWGLAGTEGFVQLPGNYPGRIDFEAIELHQFRVAASPMAASDAQIWWSWHAGHHWAIAALPHGPLAYKFDLMEASNQSTGLNARKYEVSDLHLKGADFSLVLDHELALRVGGATFQTPITSEPCVTR